MQNYFKFDIDKALLLGYNIKAVKQHADIAQSVECILGKDEVTGSNPVISSIKPFNESWTVFLLLCQREIYEHPNIDFRCV